MIYIYIYTHIYIYIYIYRCVYSAWEEGVALVERLKARHTAIERMRHMQDSQGQILAWAVREKSLKSFVGPSSLESGLGAACVAALKWRWGRI